MIQKKIVTLLIVLSSFGFFVANGMAHCEIPCGIYDDTARMNMIFEHATTIERSMQKIAELERTNNANQLVRWVTNKDKHAEMLQHIVSQYFMTQRIKFKDKDYHKKLGALHRMLVFSMKCKQTINLANVDKLRKAARDFQKLYFDHEGHHS